MTPEIPHTPGGNLLVFLRTRDPTLWMVKEKESLRFLKCQQFLFLDTKKFLFIKEKTPQSRET